MGREIGAVLATVRYPQELLDKLKAAFAPAPVYWFDPDDTTGIRSVIHQVDVAVLDADLDDVILEGENLRWIHCSHAGLNKSARREVFQRGILLTGAAGRSAPSLAEHAFFFALSLTYDVYGLHQAQQQHNWERYNKQYAQSRGLNGQTMGIVGLGNTGRAIARRAKAFDMRVLAYSRSPRPQLPPDVDAYYAIGSGGLQPLLAESDYLVLCCQLTDETHHMIGEQQLAAMKPGAVLINMGRGALVDETALVRALQGGVIRAAASDVFETEPLPKDSPLWDLPNMMITPHATPRVPSIFGNALDILLENIVLYKKGEQMRNQVQERDRYTKG